MKQLALILITTVTLISCIGQKQVSSIVIPKGLSSVAPGDTLFVLTLKQGTVIGVYHKQNGSLPNRNLFIVAGIL